MSKNSDEVYTPGTLFDALGIQFDLDVAAPPTGAVVPAKKVYTRLDDGLSKEWTGRVWMNPPYSKPTPWVHRFIEHRNGISLLPFSKGRWFNVLWEEAEAISPLPPNFKFTKHGNPHGIFMPVFLAAFSRPCVDAVRRACENRIR